MSDCLPVNAPSEGVLPDIESRLRNLIGNLREVQVRLDSLADRALGPVPKTGCSDNAQESPDNVCSKIQHRLEELASLINELEGVACRFDELA